MKNLFKLLCKAIGVVIALAAVAFAAVQAVYWLNLDNKFMFLLPTACRETEDSERRYRVGRNVKGGFPAALRAVFCRQKQRNCRRRSRSGRCIAGPVQTELHLKYHMQTVF